MSNADFCLCFQILHHISSDMSDYVLFICSRIEARLCCALYVHCNTRYGRFCAEIQGSFAEAPSSFAEIKGFFAQVPGSFAEMQGSFCADTWLFLRRYKALFANRPRSFLEAGFRPLCPPFVYFVPLSRRKPAVWICTRIRPRS